MTEIELKAKLFDFQTENTALREHASQLENVLTEVAKIAGQEVNEGGLNVQDLIATLTEKFEPKREDGSTEQQELLLEADDE